MCLFFPGKIRKSISRLPSAEFTCRVVKVNFINLLGLSLLTCLGNLSVNFVFKVLVPILSVLIKQ